MTEIFIEKKKKIHSNYNKLVNIKFPFFLNIL